MSALRRFLAAIVSTLSREEKHAAAGVTEASLRVPAEKPVLLAATPASPEKSADVRHAQRRALIEAVRRAGRNTRKRAA